MKRRPFLKSIATGIAALPFIPRKVSSAVFMAVSGGNGNGNGNGNGDWQLASGHYTPAKVAWPATAYASQGASDTASTVVFPRPNSETSTYSRQRWAHPSFDYEIPVCVRGGSFPYHMEIDATNTDSALTSTISVGANHDSTSSYIVSIPASTINGLSTSTDYDVYVKATDQEGNELKIWWSFQKEATELDHFFFADESYAGGTNDGKYATPFDNISQAGWLANADGASSSEKICVIKEGDSQTTPMTKTAGWNVSSSAFPCAFIAIPGERPKINLEDTRAFCGLGVADHFIRGYECVNGRKPGGDGDGAFINGYNNSSYPRATISDCIFDTVDNWATSGINAGAFTTEGNGAGISREYYAVVDCTFKNAVGYTTYTNEGSCITLMSWKYGLIDNITVESWGTTGPGAAQLIFFKHNNSDFTVRRMTARTSITTARSIIYGNNGGETSNGHTRNNLEFCYINGKLTSGGTELMEVPGNFSVYTDGPIYIYRNTGEGCEIVLFGTNATDIDVEHNATNVANNLTAGGAAVDELNNYEDASFESDGTLTNSYLSTKGLDRGEIGHEIA